MIDHSAFDVEVDDILDATEEMFNAFSEVEEHVDSSIMRSRKLHRLARRVMECREDMERHVLSLMERHLLACDDRNPWIIDERRAAGTVDEWLKWRFGEKYETPETAIRKSDNREIQKLRRDRIDLEMKLMDADAEIERLKAAYDKERKEHLKDLADPDIH